jgi:hypothetical protein
MLGRAFSHLSAANNCPGTNCEHLRIMAVSDAAHSPQNASANKTALGVPETTYKRLISGS